MFWIVTSIALIILSALFYSVKDEEDVLPIFLMLSLCSFFLLFVYFASARDGCLAESKVEKLHQELEIIVLAKDNMAPKKYYRVYFEKKRELEHHVEKYNESIEKCNSAFVWPF